MNLYSTYSCKIKHYNYILKQTIVIYRSAVDYCIQICLQHWDETLLIKTNNQKQQYVEQMIHSTKNHVAAYDFDQKFYKFPSYLRRAAITEAIGKVSSYKSNLENWNNENPAARGRKPSFPKAGFIGSTVLQSQSYGGGASFIIGNLSNVFTRFF